VRIWASFRRWWRRNYLNNIRFIPPLIISGMVVIHVFSWMVREVLNKSGLMRLQWRMGEFKAKITSHSTAMAQIFNAGIVRFTCSIANQWFVQRFLREPGKEFKRSFRFAATPILKRELHRTRFLGVSTIPPWFAARLARIRHAMNEVNQACFLFVDQNETVLVWFGFHV